MSVPVQNERRAKRTAAIAGKLRTKRRRTKFIRLGIAFGRRNTPTRPRRTRTAFRHQQQATRRIALREQQQTAAGLQIERLALCAERANHDRAGCRQRLLRRPERILTLLSARYDQPIERDAILREPHWIGRALLSERRILTSPNHASRPRPTRRQRQRESQSRSLEPRARRANFMQRLTSHSGRLGSEPRILGRPLGGGKGGWTRTHVLYMFYTSRVPLGKAVAE